MQKIPGVKEAFFDNKGRFVVVADMVIFIVHRTDGKILTVGVSRESISMYADEAEKADTVVSYFVKDGEQHISQNQLGYDRYKKWKCPE